MGRGAAGALCADCAELLDYAGAAAGEVPVPGAQDHLRQVPGALLQTGPPRARSAAVMRYAGPRMMLRHPRLAFYHLVIDGRREKPETKASAI